MADMNTRDIVVDTDEWIALIEKLEAKDASVKEMLDKFISALDVLIKEGFVQGTRHENMKTVREELATLRKQVDGISGSTKKTIESFYKSVEFLDKYSSTFGLM